MMFAAVALTALAVLSGCGHEERPRVRASNAEQGPQFDVASLDGLRIKELLIVIFDHDYTVAEWREIFDQTKQLSANKLRLRAIEGVLSTDTDTIRGDLIAQNAELLTGLGNRSLFIMSWSAAEENCRFQTRGAAELGCKPKNIENPLNGGLPVPVGAVEWVRPNPVTSDAKTPYLRYSLRHEGEPSFEIELRLKPESLKAGEEWFKGEAVPAPGSLFLNVDGVLAKPRFPYGYAEMTLSR
jgi:hypothetical protein